MQVKDAQNDAGTQTVAITASGVNYAPTIVTGATTAFGGMAIE